MAQTKAPRWIILMFDKLDKKWERSMSFPKPYFSQVEAEAALAQAKTTVPDVEYRLRRK